MRFIRKGGRVIPIADKAGGGPNRTRNRALAGAAAFVGGNKLAQSGARKFTKHVMQAHVAKTFKAAPNSLMKAGHTVDYWKAIKGARKGVAMIAGGTVAGVAGAGLLAGAAVSALMKRGKSGKRK